MNKLYAKLIWFFAFLFGNLNVRGGGGSSRLGQNPNFDRKLVLAPIWRERRKVFFFLHVSVLAHLHNTGCKTPRLFPLNIERNKRFGRPGAYFNFSTFLTPFLNQISRWVGQGSKTACALSGFNPKCRSQGSPETQQQSCPPVRLLCHLSASAAALVKCHRFAPASHLILAQQLSDQQLQNSARDVGVYFAWWGGVCILLSETVNCGDTALC